MRMEVGHRKLVRKELFTVDVSMFRLNLPAPVAGILHELEPPDLLAAYHL